MYRYAHWVLLALVGVLLLASTAFVVDVGESRPDPVAFDDTVELGLTGAGAVEANVAGYAVPRVQVFYSQYRYVVGYRGIRTVVDELDRPGNERQFGRPLTTYVSDFSGTNATLTPEGYLREPDAAVGWVLAPQAHFVVDSAARTPDGPAVVPFADRGEAEAFTAEYGGEVYGWDAVRSMDFGTARAGRERMRSFVANRSAWANATVGDARPLLDRPVSVVVGEDAPTVSAAVAAAPPNTTVRVPAGTYDANVTVEKPLTVRGAGNATHLRGDGNGSVVRVRAERVAVAGLRITGVGNTTSPESVPVNESGWDYRVQLGYAYGDAGVEFERANGSYVRDVAVDTPANGLLFRYSDGAVVENVTVRGSDTWQEGFMGVMDVGSRIVVQDSTFLGGRDGVYTHLADGIVVRDNRMRGMRFGVHEMYTDDALVRNNTVRDATVGVIVMTDPAGNAVVGNDARGGRSGFSVSGSNSYVAENVAADNEYGISLLSGQSLYERNTLVGNEVGLRSSSLVPTNTVVRNDVVGNDVPARAVLGPLRVWSDAESGNYWGSAPGFDRDGDGVVDRAFHASGDLDGRVGSVAGAAVLAESPAVVAQRAIQGSVPGLRATGVVDDRPLSVPVRPTVLERVDDGGDRE